jgi:acetolactate synthase I/II/III large subunit
LVEQGFTHCFFVSGGNIIHFLNAANKKITCIPVVHEVTAGIAAEYFNEIENQKGSKAFALVTAGPGLTNIVTAMASAHMESRSLLVIGGQVKSSDLSKGRVRQKGIQEIDGVAIVKPLCKVAVTIDKPLNKETFLRLVSETSEDRKGVVFLEICLDVQGSIENLELEKKAIASSTKRNEIIKNSDFERIAELLKTARRPILLIGGGVSRKSSKANLADLDSSQIPIMTTWNGADRIPCHLNSYWGRPNTWGMRYSNLLIQQSDLVIALGTRLGLQQTGFNWEEFAPLATVVQIDIDEREIKKGHPKIDLGIVGDADFFLSKITNFLNSTKIDIAEWLKFGNEVRKGFPVSESTNLNFNECWNPYDFIQLLSSHLKEGDSFIPSSSGAAETVSMQAAMIPTGVFVITDKGMASMGYGLGGAIGAAIRTNSRVIHIEGDGSFAQNLQDLGTVRVNSLPIKTFIFDNGGYASIKMAQKSYYGGSIIGCNESSGLGLPNWSKLFDAFGIPCKRLEKTEFFSEDLLEELSDAHPRAYLIPIHPDQTYYPKITSRVLPSGLMISNPLHLMSPDLSPEEIERYLPYLKDRIGR